MMYHKETLDGPVDILTNGKLLALVTDSKVLIYRTLFDLDDTPIITKVEMDREDYDGINDIIWF